MAQQSFLISGKVQGVWFRESTRRKALELGLNGIAMNLEDGRVQVIATGPAAALADLEAWLHDGPPMATVTDVQVERGTYPVLEGFTTA